jgi:hypothetical protein
MSDVILAITIFHSLSALTLIAGSALSALRRNRRSPVQRPSVPTARSSGGKTGALGMADAVANTG